MSQSLLFYPATPVSVPASVTEPSAAFKKEVSKVMGSIVLFLVVYILLVLLAVVLAAAAVYGGIALIVAFPKVITMMIGVGLIGVGVMVLFFLIKFIFAVSKFDRSDSVEITEQDHPKLFAFIRQLTKDTQTPFPKRIYLSPEVNACVFYDSSFWSMFLPVKKNLQIGLGLVNSVNLSEFKAVMAHEFGHFSQRSMKLGSFVYNVNRIIYNMLFENNSYGRSLEKWAAISGYFAFFAGLTARVVNGIQYILRQMYSVINKNYMGLSREMEFHADAVAASVSGSATCISALRRIELAGSCYGAVIEKCNELYKEKCITDNVYQNQYAVFRMYAQDFKLPLQQDLPVVDEGFLKTMQQTRVNFKDQWASHPGLEERAEHLAALQVVADPVTESAWILFDNPEQWQKQLTEKVYPAELPADLQMVDRTAFEKKLQHDRTIYSLPGVYNGFYDKRQVTVMDTEQLSQEPPVNETWETLFGPDQAGLYKKITAVETDVQVLKAIAAREIDTKTFDFDGEKYEWQQAAGIADKLQQELTALQLQLATADKKVFLFFYHKALQKSAADAWQLKEVYAQHFALRTRAETFYTHAADMLKVLDPLFSGSGMSVDDARYMIDELKQKEAGLKEQLRQWMQTGAFNANEAFNTKVSKFIDNNYHYFSGERFFENEIDDLHELSNESWRFINDFVFMQFKGLLEKQLEV
jgi:Zn-dependent protease with chaperone function